MDINMYAVLENGKEIFCSCKDESYFLEEKVVFRNNMMGLYYKKCDLIKDATRMEIQYKITELLNDQKKLSQELLNKNVVDISINDDKYACSFLKKGNMIDVSQIIVSLITS